MLRNARHAMEVSMVELGRLMALNARKREIQRVGALHECSVIRSVTVSLANGIQMAHALLMVHNCMAAPHNNTRR
jgi:hypothetical protein